MNVKWVRLAPLIGVSALLLGYMTWSSSSIPQFEPAYLLFAAIIIILSGRRITLPTGEHLNPAIPVSTAAAVLIPSPLGAVVIGLSIAVSSAYLYWTMPENRGTHLLSSPFQAVVAASVASYVSHSLTSVDYTAYPGFGLLSLEGAVLVVAVSIYQLLDVLMDEIGLSMSTMDVRLTWKQSIETVFDLFPPHASLVCLSTLTVLMYAALGPWVLVVTGAIVMIIGLAINQFSLAVRDRTRTLASLAIATIGGAQYDAVLHDALQSARMSSRDCGLTRRDSITVSDALLICLISRIALDGDPSDHLDRSGKLYESGVGVMLSLSGKDDLRLITLLVRSNRPSPSTPRRVCLIADIVRRTLQSIPQAGSRTHSSLGPADEGALLHSDSDTCGPTTSLTRTEA